MKIEVGKKYIDASGDIINIVRESEDVNYDFVDDKCIYFTKDGYFYSHKTIDEYDLICEVDYFILHKYENKIIDKYEFLMKHYIIYGGNLDWINNKTNMN